MDAEQKAKLQDAILYIMGTLPVGCEVLFRWQDGRSCMGWFGRDSPPEYYALSRDASGKGKVVLDETLH